MANYTIFASNALLGDDLTLTNNVLIKIKNNKIISIEKNSKKVGDYNYDSNYTLLPGLIDSHSHLALDARLQDHLFLMEDRESVQCIRALNAIKADLEAGITGLRSLGDRYYLDKILRDKEKTNEIIAPWMQVCGIGMKALNGHGFVGKSFSGVDEFTKVARENIYNGVDWLKLFVTAGAPSEGETISYLTSNEIKCVVDIAKDCNIKTTAHCIGGRALQKCCDNGIDMLEHCYYVDDRDIDKIISSDTSICLTPGIFFDETRLPMCPKGHVDKVMRYRDEVFERLSKLVSAKPTMIVGSDAYHGLLWRDISYLVDLGFNNRDALKAACVTPARIMNVNTGSIKTNFNNDIILVQGNPLTDIKSLSNVKAVFKGEYIKQI